MLNILIRKQFTELFSGFFVDKKSGKARTRTRAVMGLVGFFLLMVCVFGGMFAGLAYSLAPGLIEAGMDWMLFTITGLLAVVLGLFGSVFSTYASLYLAKDNELLLSMPVPVRYVILSRLISVYLMGLLYSGVVTIPASIVYLLLIPFNASALVGCVLMVLIISLLVLALSCLLGWVVAQIAGKIKKTNKTFITVLLTLVFIGIYYFVYFRISEFVSMILANAATWGGIVQADVYPLYLFGRMGTGDPIALLVWGGIVLLACALVYWALSATFLRLALAKGAVSRSTYKQEQKSARSLHNALLAREFKRFAASSTYMLNCALGVIIIPVIAVVLLVRLPALRVMLTETLPAGSRPVVLPIISAILMLTMSMTNSAAPAVSMEGRTLWILRTMPLSPRQILMPMLEVQLILNGASALVFCILSAIAVFPVIQPDAASAVLYFLLPQVFNLLTAAFCLSKGIRHAILDWTNETIAVRNNVSVLITIFVTWGIAIGMGMLGAALAVFVHQAVGMLAMTLASAGFALLFFRTLRKKDEKIFAELQ